MTAPDIKSSNTENVATGSNAPYPLAKGLPFEYPKADGVVGSVQELNEDTPKIFQPIRIGSITAPNRIGLSPLCQYAADNNEATDYHKIHYGGFTTRGAGIVIVEATMVAPNAGCSVVDLGLWKDSQAEKLKPIVDYAHANTSTIGIQLGHAGRKAMGSPLFQSLEDWDPRGIAEKLRAPSAVEYRKNGRMPPAKALTKEEIKTLVKQFGSAAKRAAEISGFDFVEIHAAHGYLINQFLSAHSNKRTDEYGGSFENRTRFLFEIIDEVKANVPKDFPIFVRISASENHDSNPDAWTIADSVKLAPLLVERGIVFIDVSSGGNDANADRVQSDFGVHVELSREVKKAVGDTAVVASVGKLNDPIRTNKLIEEGVFDFALVGSQFLLNPGLVFQWADAHDVKVHHIPSHWPHKPKYAEMIEYIQSTMQDLKTE